MSCAGRLRHLFNGLLSTFADGPGASASAEKRQTAEFRIVLPHQIPSFRYAPARCPNSSSRLLVQGSLARVRRGDWAATQFILCKKADGGLMNGNRYYGVRVEGAKYGVGFGSALAIAVSYTENHSILWAIIHGILGWLYVIYYALFRS